VLDVHQLVFEQPLVDDSQAKPARRNRADWKVCVGRNSHPSLRAIRPRSNTVKAHSSCDTGAGGRGRWALLRWSLDGLSNGSAP